MRAFSRLVSVERTEGEADLRRAIEALPGDAPRSGNLGRFTPEQITQILALACERSGKSAGSTFVCLCDDETLDRSLRILTIPVS